MENHCRSRSLAPPYPKETDTRLAVARQSEFIACKLSLSHRSLSALTSNTFLGLLHIAVGSDLQLGPRDRKPVRASCLEVRVSFLVSARVSARVDLNLLGRRLLVILVVTLLTGSLRSSLLLAATALSTRSRRGSRVSSLASGSLALSGAASRSRRVGAGALGGGREGSELLVVVLTGKGC